MYYSVYSKIVVRGRKRLSRVDTPQTLPLFWRDFGRSNYIQVRFEDVTMVPRLAAAYLYCQLGLGTVPTTVSRWIENNTRVKDCENPGTRSLATMEDTLEGFLVGKNGELGGSRPTSFGEIASRRILATSDCEREKREKSPYGTQRDSASMASLWRTQTSEEFSRAVWNACEDSGVMAELGYVY